MCAQLVDEGQEKLIREPFSRPQRRTLIIAV
jgi:hypothetical protein